jgi:hypothetical protein
MWTRRSLLIAAAAGALFAADAPPSAESILDGAKSQSNGRAIFAIFGASW